MIVGARLVSYSLSRCKDYPGRMAAMWEAMLPQIATDGLAGGERAGYDAE
jgi:hypothetical protein